MDAELFVQKVKSLCEKRGVKPTVACKASGVGASFLSDINRGQTPSVTKVQMLATYLGVTTSELLGEENKKPAAGTATGCQKTKLFSGRCLLICRRRPCGICAISQRKQVLTKIQRIDAGFQPAELSNAFLFGHDGILLC